MTALVLALNAGSSTLKFTLFSMGSEEVELDRATIEGNGREAVSLLVNHLSGERRPCAVGHRVVHGGPHHTAPTVIDDKLIGSLRKLVPLAPLHLPLAIEVIEASRELFPEATQVACFDTAFHARMPAIAHRLPLPSHLHEEGVRRYGFHGLSYEYIVSVLGDQLPKRTIIAHLGSGASMVALLDGSPVETTMGMTPTGGMVMGSRTGDLDPGVLIYLMRQKRYTVDGIEELVNYGGGLLGVSGYSADMRELMRIGNANAREAIDLFCYSARKGLGGLVALLGGCDLLVFTGGIGEHLPEICRRIAHGVPGVEQVVSLPTNEDLMIARHAIAI